MLPFISEVGRNERRRLHLPLDTRLEHPPHLTAPAKNEHLTGSQFFLERFSFLFLWGTKGQKNKRSLTSDTCSVTHGLALLPTLSMISMSGTGHGLLTRADLSSSLSLTINETEGNSNCWANFQGERWRNNNLSQVEKALADKRKVLSKALVIYYNYITGLCGSSYTSKKSYPNQSFTSL